MLLWDICLHRSERRLAQHYANYDVERDRLCDTLELNLCKGDGPEECWSYPLNAAEQEVLLRKMEAFCQQQTGMSLHDFAPTASGRVDHRLPKCRCKHGRQKFTRFSLD